MTLIVVKDKLGDPVMVLQILVLLICLYLLVITIDLEFKSMAKPKSKQCPQKLITFLISSGNGTQSKQVPQYKFYSMLVEELIIYRNKFGCEVKVPLLEIRKSITLDLKESKKIKDSFYGGLFQYLFLILFLWIFLYLASQTINFSIPNTDFGLLILWQSLGGIIYLALVKTLRTRLFSSFEIYLSSLYKLKIMLKVSRPLNEIIQAIDIENLPCSSDIKHIKDRAELLCFEIKEHGKVHSEEINFAIEEVWNFYELQLTKFNKYLGGIKMALIFIFVLPCFFYITRLIMGSMGI